MTITTTAREAAERIATRMFGGPLHHREFATNQAAEIVQSALDAHAAELVRERDEAVKDAKAARAEAEKARHPRREFQKMAEERIKKFQDEAEEQKLKADSVALALVTERVDFELAKYERDNLARELAVVKAERDQALKMSERIDEALKKIPAEPADYSREIESADSWIEWCRRQEPADWFGINFHQGMRSGVVYGQILFSKICDALRAELARAQGDKARLLTLLQRAHDRILYHAPLDCILDSLGKALTAATTPAQP